MKRAKLIAARYDQRLSQEQVAEHVGVSRVTISQWERGRTNPYPMHIRRLCQLFGKSAEELDVGISLLTAEDQEKQNTEIAISISQDTDEQLMDRREAIKTIAPSLTLLTSPLMQTSSILRGEEILSICATTIPICWRLYFDGQLSEVQQLLLPVYLPHLAQLAHQSEKEAANLASKACMLAAVIEMHYQNFGNALAHAQQGIHYGELAENFDLQVASFIQRANIYFSLKQDWRELEAYRQAHHILQRAKNTDTISPLLEGRTYIGLAKSYGKANKKPEALHFLNLAHATYPERPEDDPAFSYTCHSRFTLSNHTGLTHLNLGQAQTAHEVFTELEKSAPTRLVPRRMELLIRQAATSLALGNMREYCTYLEEATTSAITLGSDLRFNEAYSLYLAAPEKWGKEQKVKALGKLFHFSD